MRIIESQDVLSAAPAPARPARDELGGKGANLLRLQACGLPVPAWICLPTSYIAGLLARLPRPLVDRLHALASRPPGALAEPAALEALSQDLSQDLREALAGLALPPEDGEAILGSFDRAFGAEALVAVRSSAVGEDGHARSFAGLLDSFLFVSRDQLLARIMGCCASAFSARALAYRARHGLGADVRLAVIVQRMVDSAVSGVLFTANPVTQDRDELVITAGYGVGEGVVGNLVDTDTYYVARAGRGVRRELAAKTSRVVRDGATGTTIAPVPADQARRAALREDQIQVLVELGLRIEDAFGCPQDVEWAMDAAGDLHITQARPITTLERSPARPREHAPAGARAPETRPAPGMQRVFDNSNVVETFPGVTTPLTFSFARSAYGIAFCEMVRSFGVHDRVLREELATFDTLLGFLHGRIYYHLPSWYRFYSLVPGFRRNLEAWERTTGVHNPALVGEAQESARGASDRWLLAQTRVATRALWNLANLPRILRQFDERVRQFRAHHERRMARARSVDDLLAHYDELIAGLVRHWAPALINDVYLFNFYDLLQALLRQSDIEDPDTLCAELLCGISGLESMAPMRSLLQLVDQIRGTPALRALFAGTADDQAVWDALQRDPAHAPFRQAAARHIQRYGDRIVEEMKLETPGLAEAPASLIGLCRAYLAAGRDLRAQETTEPAIRAAAEGRLRAALRRRPARLALVWLLLRQTRATVKNREHTRLARTRMFGMARRIFRAVGERYAQAGILDAPEDICFLTVDEIQSYARGTSATSSIRDLVRIRRAEHARFQDVEPAGRIETRGIVHAAMAATAPAPASAADAGDGQARDVVLAGQGCAPGRVRARCRVLRSPRDETAVAGQVLVAPSTDPGWIFLMTAASGLVVERGNLLSHAAIIGRELGIPTVIGVAGATRRIPEGAWVEVDGGRGTVTIAAADGREHDHPTS